MAHMDVQQGIEVQLNRQQLSSIRPPQYEGGGLISAVSCLNGVLMGLALLLVFFMQVTHGSSTPCIEFPRAAAEHTIEAGGRTFVCHHAGPGPGNYHSCRGGAAGAESCWSCSDLDTSTPNREPFFLQSISSYGRLQASLGEDVVLREFSLGQFKDWPSYQFRMRKLGPIANHSPKDWRTDVVSPGVGEQHWTLVDIATVCSRDPAPSSSVSPPGGSPDGIQLDRRNSQLQVASWSWRCNSTVVATAASGATAAARAESSMTDSTISATASSDVDTTTATTISVQMEMQIRKSDPWVLQILHAVDEKLHASSCVDDGDGPQSVRATGVMGRRVLISDSWKPVIVADSVVVGIGFLLALSALSCWVWQRRTVKAYAMPNNSVPSSSIARGLPATRESPRRGSRVTDAGQISRSASGDDGRGRSAGASGRWAQVREGPGRWVQIEEQVPGGGSPGANERSGTVARVAEHGIPSGGLPGVEELSVPGPRVGEEGEEVVAEGPPTELRVSEEGQRSGSHAAAGEGTPVTAEGPHVRSGGTEGDETTATAHRSSPTAGYRVEPFCFRGLSIATGGFDDGNRLGEGSFGTVYRGLLFDGREVAIKRAVRNNMQKLVDVQSSFKAEIDVLSRLHHKHLVNLVGYCDECGEMMLVYEYMPNGTLSDHIHNRRLQSRALSSWKVRIKVALQAARGIEYLHTYAEPPVIHRDIKSSNILLDSNGSARVSDFGLCLIFPTSSDDEDEVDAEMGHSSRVLQHLTTKAAGTIGYMDPEYYRHRHLTTKSDVYSFGVVMLELLTGKKAIFRRNNVLVSIVDYSVPAIETDDLASILDPRVQAPNRREFLAIEVMAEVGRQAVRLQGKERPSMTEIIRRLEDAVTLCRPRHAPLPVFGAQIGSSSDPSPSPRSELPSREPSAGPSTTDPLRAATRSTTDPLRAAIRSDDPAASASLHQFVEGADEGDEEEDEGPSGTDIAQVGSLSSSQALVLEEFLQEIHPNGTDNDDDEDNDFDHFLSNVDIQFCYDSADPGDQPLRPQSSAAAGAPGSEPGSSNINVIPSDPGQGSSSSAMAAEVSLSGSQGAGERQSEWLRPHTSSLWQQAALLQELQESSRRQSQSSSSTGKFGTKSGAFDDSLQRQRGSYYSCEGGSAEASAMELPLDYYSAMVVDDPLLDQRTSVMAGFSNFSDVGPPVDLNPPSPGPPPLPLQLSQEQQDLGSQLVRAAHGFRELPGYQHESEPSDRHGPGLQGSASGGLDKGKELERTPDELIGDIDIQEFLGAQYSEPERETTYAGFSNFSVLHDLDELMKALHSLHAQQEQEELDELREQQQQEENLWKHSKSSGSSVKG